eukprot:COSAG02_NODE_884_length_16193_cov_20.464086_12_plen_61_part_00
MSTARIRTRRWRGPERDDGGAEQEEGLAAGDRAGAGAGAGALLRSARSSVLLWEVHSGEG